MYYFNHMTGATRDNSPNEPSIGGAGVAPAPARPQRTINRMFQVRNTFLVHGTHSVILLVCRSWQLFFHFRVWFRLVFVAAAVVFLHLFSRLSMSVVFLRGEHFSG